MSTAVVLKQVVTLAGNMKSTNNRDHTVIPKGKYTYPLLFQLAESIALIMPPVPCADSCR
jgi:hypothetical protein